VGSTAPADSPAVNPLVACLTARSFGSESPSFVSVGVAARPERGEIELAASPSTVLSRRRSCRAARCDSHRCGSRSGRAKASFLTDILTGQHCKHSEYTYSLTIAFLIQNSVLSEGEANLGKGCVRAPG
jgi:hypothetical protein